MNSKKENSVLTILFLFFSLIIDFFRSLLLLFWYRPKNIDNNLFFDFLEFIFKLWPKKFWEKPSLYRLFSFFWDLIDYLILQNAKK